MACVCVCRRMNNLGAGSDHAPMLDKLGVPCLNIEYGNASTAYPLYHSAYDSFHASELMDPTFAVLFVLLCLMSATAFIFS